MAPKDIKKAKNGTFKTIILTVLVIMLISLIAWHVMLPLLGITIAITSGIWGIAVGMIALICAASLLFFIFTGVGILIFGLFVAICGILSIFLFPFLFPILLPALLLMFVIGYIAGKKKEL